MLTAAALGMAGYGLYEIGFGVSELIAFHRLELWAALASIALGLILVLAAALVRVMLPGGLELALGALLGLQALALHNVVHTSAAPTVTPHLSRGVLAILLIALAYIGTSAASSS